ncbi:hypothetical protein [Tardibacter chloracetimidivorans]|uniref:hypothetical protein n=1 Tax=Tardibacter chloracetimidivorans TaxID=1921510 RepID=UPI00138FBBC1|nr:hypothetical protein [Tardibacter chloracetimidivorans]
MRLVLGIGVSGRAVAVATGLMVAAPAAAQQDAGASELSPASGQSPHASLDKDGVRPRVRAASRISW